KLVASRARPMIILSKLADYGVIVATHLATQPERQATAAAVAGATRLPQATVAKLLKALAHAGLVVATRGAAGGYRLARRATEISVAAVTLDDMISPFVFLPAAAPRGDAVSVTVST